MVNGSQAAGLAADIENAVTVQKATKSDQKRRESAAPPPHDLFVGVGVLEARESGIGIGHR
jgi:hypothetical protein